MKKYIVTAELIIMLPLCILLASFNNLHAQNPDRQSRHLNNLQTQYVTEKQKLDSLQAELDTHISRAENLKAQAQDNDSRVANIMANALNLSRAYDHQKLVTDAIAGQIRQERRFLYKAYTQHIDSLNEMLGKTNSTQEQENIRLKLHDLNSRRVRVSPALPLFSFDPALINNLKLSAKDDSTRILIYHEYLSNALDEVDSNIAILRDKSSEVRTMMKLNVQANEFIEDVNDGQMFSMLQLQNSDQARQVGSSSPLEYDSDRMGEIIGLKTIFTKLEPVLGDRYEMPRFSEVDSLLSDEYLELLENTENTLKLYREIIKDKLTP